MSKVTRSRLLMTVVSAALAAASLAALPGGSASAATTCALVPQLRDITVTQGVGSYNPLVRGKEALVRSYLSMPSCVTTRGPSIAVTGATLNVTTPGGTTRIDPDNLVTSPAPILAPFTSAPAVDSPADTRFVIPGSVLAPAASAARFTATMTVTINYSSKTSNTASPVAGSVSFTTRPGSTSPISSVVEKRSNALRILVVPMGDPRIGYSQQFNATAQATTAGAMRALARTLPVPDGTGDLTSLTSTAGIRYAVTPTIADITAFNLNGKFCGTAANFDRVAANLSTFLQSWNTNNPTTPADRVIGVVADTLSLGGDAGCAEGMSKVGQPITWTRLTPDGATPSQAGSTMAMEIAHTFGGVPLTATNADPFSRYHSKNTQADDTAPNRAYNVPTRQFLATDRTVMAVRDAWNDQTTLLEPSDWAFTLCALTPAPPTSCPAATTTVGTAQGVGNEPTFVISGVITKGTPDTAEITESYFKNGVPRFNVDDTSPYRLVQKMGETTIDGFDVGIAVNFETSDHDTPVDPVGPPNTNTVETGSKATFTAAVPFRTGAERIVLEKNGVTLYARDKADPPVVTDVSPGVGAGSTERVSSRSGPPSDPDIQAYGTTYSSDISGDGKYVVFRTPAQLDPIDNNEYDDIYLRNVASKETTLVSAGISYYGADGSNGSSYDPVISADGSTVAFVSAASNLVDPGIFDEQQHLYVYDVGSGSLDVADLSSVGGLGNGYAVGRPALSATGQYVAFASRADNLVAALTAPDSGSASRVYLRDLNVEGSTTLVSRRDPSCAAPQFTDCTDRGQQPGSITDDGRFVSFVSNERLTEYSPVGRFAAYVRDTQSNSTVLATVGLSFDGPCNPSQCSFTDAPINGDVLHPPLLSPLSGPNQAKYIVYDSNASNLVPNDNNGASDVFYSVVGGSYGGTRLSQVPGTLPIDGTGDLDGNSYLLDVTPDLGCDSSSPSCANRVLLASNASNFSADDFAADPQCEVECVGEVQDVFSYDFVAPPIDTSEYDFSLGSTVPTLATVASDGTPAIDDTDSYDSGLTYAYKPGGISDDGSAATFVSTAPNLDAGDSNHYADAFVRKFGGPPSAGAGVPYSVSATGAVPGNLRIDLVFRCGAENDPNAVRYPIAVALKPDDVGTTSASWSVNVDPSLIGSCPAGSGLVANANDGFSTSQGVDAPTQPTLEPQPPAPAIYGPAPGAAYSTYLQYSTVTLDGTARDAEDGVLPGSSLDWFITPPGGSEAAAGTGSSVRKAPPTDSWAPGAYGWAPGVYGVRLRATDSDGNQTSTTSTFTILEDRDNDGVPVLQDRTGDTGAGCPGVAGSGDTDPSNAYSDPDSDGVITVDEIAFSEQPCAAATGGTAGATTLRIAPNPVPSSSGTPITFYLTASNAAETQVLARSVQTRLTATPPIGAPGAGVPQSIDLSLLSSSATSTLFTGKYARQSLLAFARQFNLYGRPITVRLTGYVSGSGPITATATITVKK